MKLLFLLTVVLGLSLNSLRVTRRRRVPPSRRQVRRRLLRLRARRLLVALFAASTLQWITRKPWNQHSQSTKRIQLPHPVQNLPTAAAPSAGCKRTRIRSDFQHTRRLLIPAKGSVHPGIGIGGRKSAAPAAGQDLPQRETYVSQDVQGSGTDYLRRHEAV